MRPIMKAFYLLAVLSAISLTSCFTPQRVIQMESAEDEVTKWNYGRQVVLTKDGDIEARIYFEDFTKKDLIFDVEVVNVGDKELLLNPSEIYFETDNGGKVWSFDPENEIFGERVEMSRQEARSKNTAVAIGVAAVATIAVVAATSDGDGNGNNGGGDAFDNTVNSFVYVNTAIPPPLPMEFMPPSLNFWKDYALRKTSLDKDYKVGGKVVFPRFDDTRTITVVVPVEGHELRATFHQRIFQP